MTTGFNHGGLTIPRKGGIQVDLKRMDQLVEIDEEGLTAVIEPGVRMRFLYHEAHKIKTHKDIPLKPILPGSLASISLLSNYVSRGGPGGAVKYGGNPDLTAAMTWVLPNGDVLKLGPSAFSKVGNVGLHYGSGPDVGGMFFNADGAFGICTDIAVKLYPEQTHEELMVAAVWTEEDSLPIACQAVYELSRANIMEFIYKSHGAMLGVQASQTMDADALEVTDMVPEDFLLLVANGFDEEEVGIKMDIVREILDRLDLVEMDLSLLGEGIANSTDATKMSVGIANNTVGAYRGAFQWQAAWIKVEDVPEAWERYKKLIRKYWKTSDPEISMKQSMTGTGIQGPLPYSRVGTLEFDFWWDQGNPEDVKRASVMFKKATELLLDMGGIPIRNMFGYGELLIPRLGVYTEILKDMRSTFDPENLMHPDVLPVTDDYV